MLRFCFEPLSPDVLFSKKFVQGLTLRTLIFDNFYVLLSIQIDFTFLLVIFFFNFFSLKNVNMVRILKHFTPHYHKRI